MVKGIVSTIIGVVIVAVAIFGWNQYHAWQHEQNVQTSTSTACPQVPVPLYNNGTDCP